MNQTIRRLMPFFMTALALTIIGVSHPLRAHAAGAQKIWTLIWEGEQVPDLDPAKHKSFKVIKYTRDATGSVSGKRVIGIDKLPKGEKVEADEITYRVKIPATGVYYLWARVFWSTGCGNSFLLKVGDMKGTYVLGGDGTYEALHWISLNNAGEPRKLKLNKGTVDITLIAKESGAMVDQFYLTTDVPSHNPAGCYTPTPDVLDMKPKK